MPITVPQTNSATWAAAGDTTKTVTFGGNTTAGSDLFCLISLDESQTVSACEANLAAGGTSAMTQDVINTNRVPRVWIYSLPNVAAATGIKVTWSAALSNVGGLVAIVEAAGAAASSPLDNSSTTDHGATTVARSIALTPNVANCLFLAIISQGSGGGVDADPPSGWTSLGTKTTGGMKTEAAYLIATDASQQTAQWTDASANVVAAMAIASYKPAVSTDPFPAAYGRQRRDQQRVVYYSAARRRPSGLYVV